MSGSEAAFAVLIAGIAGIVFELWRPGWIVPGVAGAGAVLGGFFFLCSHAAEPRFVLTLASAGLVCFIAEVFAPVRWVSGGIGMLALSLAFARCGVAPALVLPPTLVVGFVLTLLAAGAHQARLNKAI